jgi:imidazolonepropionase-like amidohydrolase
MNATKRLPLLLLLLIFPIATSLCLVTAARGEPFAIAGATIHPIGGPDIPNGVLIVDGGRIRQLGSTLAVDPSMTRIDATGKHLYPGFIQAHSTLGLIEIGSVRGTVDTTETGNVNANLRAETAFNADSQMLLPAMAGGVLTAHVAATGGVYNGTSALVKLRGWNWQDMTLRSPVGFFLTYPQIIKPDSPFSRQSEEDFNKEKDAALKALKDTWLAADAYRKARKAAADGVAPRVEVDSLLEAFAPALDGTVPVFLRAASRPQIAAALDWAKQTKLTRWVLVSGADAQHFAERLAKENIPVILDGVLALPDRAWDSYDSVYAAAAKLHAAGVRLALGDGDDPSNARNLPFHAGMAAAFGLPPDAALRAITLSVAEILGVESELGSLAPAKRATFFLATGDPLDIRTRIERVWVDGEEIDLKADRQWQLYQRYDHRPKRDAHGAHGD